MSKKHEFPLAKVRSDGVPAVWLDFAFWYLIKDALVTKYVQAREGMGRRQALIEDKLAKDYDLWPFDVGTAEDAIRYYRIGWGRCEQGKERTPMLKMPSPEELIAKGDLRERHAYQAAKLNHAEGKVAA